MTKIAKGIVQTIIKVSKSFSPLSVGVIVSVSGVIFYLFNNYDVVITKKRKKKEKPISFLMFSETRESDMKKKKKL